MRTLPRGSAPVVFLLLAGCAGDPWVEWPLTEVALSDLAITRTAWDQGRATEPGPDGQPRYSWQVDIENTSTTIWSGRVQIIAEFESGGTTWADTLSDRLVIPGRRVVTAANVGRLAAYSGGEAMPRFHVRIGAWCATIHGESGDAAPCPEEPAAEAQPPADVGPPIR